MTKKTDIKLLFEIFITTLKIGAFTFGGGIAMIPIMEIEFVDKKKWVKREDILDIFAVSQSAPGAVSINTCIFLGRRLSGFTGAVAAALGIILPSFIIIIIISYFYVKFKESFYINSALRGIRACVVALIVSAAISMGKTGVKGTFGVIIALSSIIATAFFNINAIIVILLAAAAGIGYSIYKGRLNPYDP